LASLETQQLIHAPERELSLWRWLNHAAQGPGTVTVADVTLNWAELESRARRLACGLQRRGLRQGDRIGSIMTDRIEALELAFAAAALGAIWVPLGPFLKGRFLAHQLKTAEPTLLITDVPGARATAPYIAQTGTLSEVIHLDPVAGATHLADIYADGDVDPVEDGRTPAAILFTSGTTGPAKGCVVTQGYFAKAGCCYGLTLDVAPNDVIYTAFPLFHGAGLATAMMAVVAQATFRHPGSFRASTYMADAANTGATISIGTGGMATAILNQPARADDRTHSLRVAEWVPLGRGAQQRFSERFGVQVYGEHYGQTECMITTQTPLHDASNPGTAGRESPLVQVAIVDDDGQPVGPDAVGEIVVRPRTSGAMFSGYWRQPGETLAAWRDLWHHTGDYGALDARGNLSFVDRKSDSMRRRGENISSLQLEAAILEHPDITDVAVHAVPSSMTEDDIKACIVLVPGADLQPATLFEYFAEVLPYFAVPRYVDVMESLPRTPNQKVQKSVLRDLGNSSSTWDFEALGLAVKRAARRQSVRTDMDTTPRQAAHETSAPR